jgi:adenylyltransferase/sulfurtransferase
LIPKILLPEVGEAGQQKLLNATVLLIGIGGLGSPSAMYLAAATQENQQVVF